MANILIRFCATLILFINLFTSVVKADSNNIKQCFYILSEDTKSTDLYKDLELFKDKKIPIMIVINPNENINKKVIEVLEDFQKEENLGVILEEDKNIERSYFAVKGYDKSVKVSGFCNIEDDKLIYIGEENLLFNLIDISLEPLQAISEIDLHKEKIVDYALVVDSKAFNISTLLYANNELKGFPLDISDYRISLKEPGLMDNIVIYVGYTNTVIFSISIIIFIGAIIIFKKWSTERFLD